ncbi:MAG: hypothetical protein ABSC64_05325 [Candidatus Korobacteraceae bacterium]
MFLWLIAIVPYIRRPLWNHQIGAGMTINEAIGGACLLYATVYVAQRRGGIPPSFKPLSQL